MQFAERVGIAPDHRVLNLLDPFMAKVLSSMVEGYVVHIGNEMEECRGAKYCIGGSECISSSAILPLKSKTFDVAVCYSMINMLPNGVLKVLFKELERVLRDGGKLALLCRAFEPRNDAQISDLLLCRALQEAKKFWMHGHSELTKLLNASGFSRIKIEIVDRSVKVPKEFVDAHISYVKSLGLGSKYVEHASKHGEELLPALQIVART